MRPGLTFKKFLDLWETLAVINGATVSVGPYMLDVVVVDTASRDFAFSNGILDRSSPLDPTTI
jgi:hypothetical protein